MSKQPIGSSDVQSISEVGYDSKKQEELSYHEVVDGEKGPIDTNQLTDHDGAIAAEIAEQQMTFREAIRDYPAAIFWSFAISLCIIMEGYDTALPVST
jgi:hypothetical protein